MSNYTARPKPQVGGYSVIGLFDEGLDPNPTEINETPVYLEKRIARILRGL